MPDLAHARCRLAVLTKREPEPREHATGGLLVGKPASGAAIEWG
ncbi:hypothetical protein PQR67_26880 [Paraburkholderia fungorum]